MKIETKYNIGDEVWWKTKSYNGKATVESIEVRIKAHDTYCLVGIRTADGVGLVFHEHELSPTKEELLKSL